MRRRATGMMSAIARLFLFFLFLATPAHASANAAILASFPDFQKNVVLKAGENTILYLYIVNNAEVSDENCWAVVRFEVYRDNQRVQNPHILVVADPENQARDLEVELPDEYKDAVAVFTAPGQPVAEIPPKSEWSAYTDTYVGLRGDNRFYPARMVKIAVCAQKNAAPGRYLIVFPVFPWKGQGGGMQVVGEAAPSVVLNVVSEAEAEYLPIVLVCAIIVAAVAGLLLIRKLQRK